MATAINKACIWWLHENCYFVKGVFAVLEMGNFFAAGQDSLPIDRIFPKELGDGAGQLIPIGDKKQD